MSEYIFEIDGALFNEETGEAVMKPKFVGRLTRCKDCKHKHIENMVWTCPFGLPGGELFFCAYGAERRTDESND